MANKRMKISRLAIIFSALVPFVYVGLLEGLKEEGQPIPAPSSTSELVEVEAT